MCDNMFLPIPNMSEFTDSIIRKYTVKICIFKYKNKR